MKLHIVAVLVLSAAQLFAQKCVNPHFDAQRLDFRDLGYPGATEIPADSSPITALLAHSNGRVYGATTGKASHLFAWDARVNKVFPLGILASAKGVHHALVEGPDGIVYIGTGLGEIGTEIGTLRLTRDMPEGRRAIETQLWKDIQSHYAAYEGGHLYAYDPVKGDDAVYLEGTHARVVDLGIPVPSNSVYALTISPDGKTLYGISYPDAEFFAYDIAAKTFARPGKWMEKLAYPGPERTWRGVPRALVCTPNGTVWSSGDDGLLRAYIPALGAFSETHMRIPGEYWETQAYNGFPVVEQLFAKDDGTLVGTTSDGFIFTAQPNTDTLQSWGKPRVERRGHAPELGQAARGTPRARRHARQGRTALHRLRRAGQRVPSLLLPSRRGASRLGRPRRGPFALLREDRLPVRRDGDGGGRHDPHRRVGPPREALPVHPRRHGHAGGAQPHEPAIKRLKGE